MTAPECIPSEGERMVYLVASATHPGRTYRVDLLAENGASRCACRDWDTRRGPAITRGEPHGTRATLCRHGIIARRHFLNALLADMARAETNPNDRR